MLAAPGRVPDRRVDEVLELVGLTSVARKSPRSLSLGMAQRLGLALSLLGDPRVLILDGPAGGLDPQGINWLRGFLQSYAATSRTVLVSSHQLAEMAQMVDDLIVIGRGRLIADLTVEEFELRRSLKAVTVRTPQAARFAIRSPGTAEPSARSLMGRAGDRDAAGAGRGPGGRGGHRAV